MEFLVEKGEEVEKRWSSLLEKKSFIPQTLQASQWRPELPVWVLPGSAATAQRERREGRGGGGNRRKVTRVQLAQENYVTAEKSTQGNVSISQENIPIKLGTEKVAEVAAASNLYSRNATRWAETTVAWSTPAPHSSLKGRTVFASKVRSDPVLLLPSPRQLTAATVNVQLQS